VPWKERCYTEDNTHVCVSPFSTHHKAADTRVCRRVCAGVHVCICSCVDTVCTQAHVHGACRCVQVVTGLGWFNVGFFDYMV
jgi:hypothetical protein